MIPALQLNKSKHPVQTPSILFDIYVLSGLIICRVWRLDMSKLVFSTMVPFTNSYGDIFSTGLRP